MDGPDGVSDIPGHFWQQAGTNQLVGKHFNTGPFGAPQWWSSDAPDGEFLYVVRGIIDTWTAEKAAGYARRGYVHYHELKSENDEKLHPTKVVWLKHTAVGTFNLDGGPHPELWARGDTGTGPRVHSARNDAVFPVAPMDEFWSKKTPLGRGCHHRDTGNCPDESFATAPADYEGLTRAKGFA